MSIRIGTRGSKLAIIQAKIVADKLQNLGHECEVVIITTSGDKEKVKPLYDIGGKALFVKELEEALLAQSIDLAVHSLKDVPGMLPPGLRLAAMLEREDPRDVLVSKYKSIIDLPTGAKIGTSSPRRIMYIKNIRRDLEIIPIRGNVDTRYNKIAAGELDATILAYAGLKRLGGYLDSGLCHPIPVIDMIPSIGQGVIALEILDGDSEVARICAAVNHQATWDLMQVERSFLEHSNSSCRSPIAALAKYDGDKIKADFMLADDDWAKFITYSESCPISEGYELGKKMAAKMKIDLN